MRTPTDTPQGSQKAFQTREEGSAAREQAEDEFADGWLDGEFVEALDAEAILDELCAQTDWRDLLEMLEAIAPEHVAKMREQVVQQRADDLL